MTHVRIEIDETLLDDDGDLPDEVTLEVTGPGTDDDRAATYRRDGDV